MVGRGRRSDGVTHGCGPGYPQRKSVVVRPSTAVVEVECEPEVVGAFTGSIVILTGSMARSWRDISHDNLVSACVEDDGCPANDRMTGTGIKCQLGSRKAIFDCVFTSLLEEGLRGLGVPLQS